MGQPKSKSKSKLRYDRRSVCQSVLVSSTHLGPKTRFLLLSDSFGFVDVGVYRLQLFLVIASGVILGSESSGTHDHILLSHIRDSSNMEGQVPVFISLRNRMVQLYPQALSFLFVASYDSQGYGRGNRTRLQDVYPWRSPDEGLVIGLSPPSGPHRKHSFQQYFYCCVFFSNNSSTVV
jgi:hypothetical protein